MFRKEMNCSCMLECKSKELFHMSVKAATPKHVKDILHFTLRGKEFFKWIPISHSGKSNYL